MVIIQNIKGIVKNKLFKQTTFLYTAKILVILFGFIIMPIITRHLGPEKYGIFAFVLTLINFIALFFDFGIFPAGSRFIALEKNKDKSKELIGSLIILTIFISISLFIIYFVLSFFVDSLFNIQVNLILRIISIFAAILPFQYLVQLICQGANEIYKMSYFELISKFWYLIGILIFINLFSLNVTLILIINLTGIILSSLLILKKLHPSFSNIKNTVAIIWKETKTYGKNIYIARIAATSTYELDKLVISFFINTVTVGFYNLAIIATSPMTLMSVAFSTSLFKKFAHYKNIPKKIFYYNFLWLLICIIGIFLFGKHIIIFLLTEKYLAVVPIMLILSFAAFFQGMYQPINMFLSARGKSIILRKIAFIFSGVNIIGNILVVPIWGAIGAAIVSVISMASAFFFYYYYYKQYLTINKTI